MDEYASIFMETGCEIYYHGEFCQHQVGNPDHQVNMLVKVCWVVFFHGIHFGLIPHSIIFYLLGWLQTTPVTLTSIECCAELVVTSL